MFFHFTVNRIYTQTEGSITRDALTDTWSDGASLPVEAVTDFEPTEGVAVIDPDGTPETIYFTGVNLDNENLTGVVRPNAANHAAGVFIQSGASPTTRKLAAGYFDSDPNAEVRGVPIRAALEPWHPAGFRDAGTEYVVEGFNDPDDEDQPWIVSAPIDNPDKSFDADLNVLPPVGGGDSSTTTTDPNSGKVLPPKGMGFEDGDVPSGTVVAEAFGGIGNTLWVNWTSIANSSQLTYEVHVSTDTGFTPDDGTLYAARTLSGEPGLLLGQEVKDFPSTHDLDGTASDPPQPGTDYFIVVRVRDGSGYGTDSAQVSATPLETIPDDAITTTKIADNAIETPKLAANAVTAAKIAANTITAAQIAAGTITATQIATGTITADRLNVSTLSAITA
ncbi:MAG: hypothetical protein GEU71_09395, partial [Actinobacteria bacterium]|nr:hypothetical protein [Actinomycetota bacterium]